MTTEKQTAEQPAATDQTDRTLPPGDSLHAADTSTEPAPAPASHDNAGGASALEDAEAEPPRKAEASSGHVTGPEAAQAEPSRSAPPPPEASAAEAAGASEPASRAEVPETAPLRRFRLNPTVPPEAARPIPSLPSGHSSTQTSEAHATRAPQAPASSGEQSASGEQTAAQAPAALNPQTPAEAATGSTQQIRGDEAAASAEESAGTTETQPVQKREPVPLPGRNESLDADLEAELDAAMAAQPQQEQAEAAADAAAEAQGEHAAGAALSPVAEVKRGARATGTVASIHGDDMFLDLGLRMPGVLSRRQFGLRKQPMQGETLEVVVGRFDEKEGLIHVNLPTGTSRVRGEWEALSVDQNVECMVTGTNKGGLEVSIGALRGFMPASQVELGFVPDLNVYVGQRLKARVAEVNPKRRKLVLSRRALIEEEREQSQQELFEKIQPGQQYTGRVRSLKDYGAFVDIGGADGLLHVAQISWSRINHPSEVLKEGEEIEVQVLSVDRDKKKISLGMRQLKQNPWKQVESKFAPGTQVHGKVTRVENFGAFVELEEGVEGLVHISELDHKRVNRVADVLRVGQEIDVQVLEVDSKRKRVSLSLKALKEKPEDPQEKAEAAPVKRQRNVDTLVGGIGTPTGGQLFGDPNRFRG